MKLIVTQLVTISVLINLIVVQLDHTLFCQFKLFSGQFYSSFDVDL